MCNFQCVSDFYTFYYTFISTPFSPRNVIPLLYAGKTAPLISNQYPLHYCYWHSFFPNPYLFLFFLPSLEFQILFCMIHKQLCHFWLVFVVVVLLKVETNGGEEAFAFQLLLNHVNRQISQHGKCWGIG